VAELPKLYSAVACNWCHRCRVLFDAKGVEVEVVDIDLVRRPEWFRNKASGGSVPLLETEDGAFHGSAIINEYAEERWPEPALLPGSARERAEARMWIAWWNAGPTPHYEELLMNVRPERQDGHRARLEASLRECEERLASRGYGGGYWHGDRLGLVDASAAPVFDRFVGLRHFHDFDIPQELGRVRAWRDHLLADPHVQATSPGEEALLQVLSGYRDVLGKAAAAGIEVAVSGGD
jgi:glutathione S-transferase